MQVQLHNLARTDHNKLATMKVNDFQDKRLAAIKSAAPSIKPRFSTLTKLQRHRRFGLGGSATSATLSNLQFDATTNRDKDTPVVSPVSRLFPRSAPSSLRPTFASSHDEECSASSLLPYCDSDYLADGHVTIKPIAANLIKRCYVNKEESFPESTNQNQDPGAIPEIHSQSHDPFSSFAAHRMQRSFTGRTTADTLLPHKDITSDLESVVTPASSSTGYDMTATPRHDGGKSDVVWHGASDFQKPLPSRLLLPTCDF